MRNHCSWLLFTGVTMAAGCSSSHSAPTIDEGVPPIQTTPDEPAFSLDDPPEVFTNEKGVRFRLVGEAQVAAPVNGIHRPSGPSAKGRVEERAMDRERLAESLRPVMLVGGRWEYVGEEPAYEMADAILRGESPAHSVANREGRRIIGPTCGSGSGPCDNRYHVNAAYTTGSFYRPVLFMEYGCTATMIDRSTAVTAAHCVYNNQNNHWYVLDDVACANTVEDPNSNSAERRNPGSSTNRQNCLPRYAPGMNNNGAPLGWLSCYNVTFPGDYRTADDLNEGRRYDYAVIDFRTSYCPDDYPGDETGWRGTWIAGSSDFSSNDANITGFPRKSRPGYPDNSYMGSAAQFPVRHAPNDCGPLTTYLKGTEDLSYWACESAMMVGATGGPGSFLIDPMGHGSWQLGTSILDTSAGQSGSAWVLYGTSPSNSTAPSTASNEFLVGIHSGAEEGLPINVARKWDNTVYNFVSANSNFPTVN